MARVLVADPIDDAGVQKLTAAGHEADVKTGMKPDELLAIIADYDALIVRSETKVTAEVIAKASRLQAVGRAGVGVDNIDIDAATEHGIAVVNAPRNVVALQHKLGNERRLAWYALGSIDVRHFAGVARCAFWCAFIHGDVAALTTSAGFP